MLTTVDTQGIACDCKLICSITMKAAALAAAEFVADPAAVNYSNEHSSINPSISHDHFCCCCCCCRVIAVMQLLCMCSHSQTAPAGRSVQHTKRHYVYHGHFTCRRRTTARRSQRQ